MARGGFDFLYGFSAGSACLRRCAPELEIQRPAPGEYRRGCDEKKNGLDFYHGLILRDGRSREGAGSSSGFDGAVPAPEVVV